jgi:hypothetical protein
MAAVNTSTTLDGMFKEQYVESIAEARPMAYKAQRMIPYRVGQRQEQGKSFNQPVALTFAHGVSYAAADEDGFTLATPIAGEMKNANLKPSQMLLAERIGYEAAARASNDVKAFRKVTGWVVFNMNKSIQKRLETGLLYGGTSLARLNADPGTGPGARAAVISDLTWAAGIWAGAKNAELDAYADDGSGQPDASTQRNSTEAITIDSVSIATKTLTLSGVEGELDDLEAGDHLVWRGSLGKEMTGLDLISSNAGTLFGISAASYDVWAGNSYSCGSAPLTMGKVLQGLAEAVNKGLEEDVVLLCSSKSYENLNRDQGALRAYDSSYQPGKAKNGFRAIQYEGQSGMISVVAHTMVKEGEAFAFPPSAFRRIGASDVTFQLPGEQEKFFLHRQDVAAYELRVYSDQSLFTAVPGHCVKFTGIVPST